MQTEEIIKMIVGSIDAAVAARTEPLVKRIADLEAVEPEVFDSTALEKSLKEKLDEALANVPKPKDGEPGKDAEPVKPEAVAEAMKGLFSEWALGFERLAQDKLDIAVKSLVQPKDGLPGRDALELEDLGLVLAEDGRTVTISLKRGETVIEKSIKLATILDRGVFRPEQAYEKGDAVTYGGSVWIAQKDAPEGKPGNSADFRLAVKAGRNANQKVKI